MTQYFSKSQEPFEGDINITNLATKTTLKSKINEVKGKIPSITNLATTTALTAVENEIRNVCNLVKNLVKKT